MTTPTQPAELLPCPFCGGTVTVEQEDGSLWYINCDKCDITTAWFVARSQAISVWNRRAPNATDQATIQQQQERIADLERELRLSRANMLDTESAYYE